MSVTCKHLNADSSFLLLFSPDPQPSPPGTKSSSAVYSILIDPWLQGDSIVTAPWFAITKCVVPACIQHLSEIDEPDVVIVSQNKPDHCHGQTLRQLRPDGKTIVAAEPGAAKAIKAWNHFDPARVLSLPKFNPQKKFSYTTFYIPPLSPGGHRGVVTISFIPARNYMTGLHNAIGIIYLAPTHFKTVAPVPTVDLQKRTQYFHLPLSPAISEPPPPASQTRPLTAGSNSHRTSAFERPLTAGAGGYRPRLSQGFPPVSPITPQFPQRPPYSPPPIFTTDSDSTTSTFSTYTQESPTDTTSPVFQPKEVNFFAHTHPFPTPPQSPINNNNHSSSSSSSSSTSTFPTTHTPHSSTTSTTPKTHPPRPRPLSILYTPHGIPFTPDLLPYAQHQLLPHSALPLTLLLHSFSRSTNPWYLGGNITAGTPGGVQIARGLMARVWVSAHDEAKDDRGVSVKQLRTERRGADEVRTELWRGAEEWGKRRGWDCDVRSLGAGGEVWIGQVRDLVGGVGAGIDGVGDCGGEGGGG